MQNSNKLISIMALACHWSDLLNKLESKLMSTPQFLMQLIANDNKPRGEQPRDNCSDEEAEMRGKPQARSIRQTAGRNLILLHNTAAAAGNNWK